MLYRVFSSILNLIWHNDTSEEMIFGEMYTIEYKDGNEWKDVSVGDIFFNEIANLLGPKSEINKSYTTEQFDISKDGTLSGVNVQQLKALADATEGRANIVASGGVHTMNDIIACKEMGLYGTICGKSIYKGTLNLKEAIDYAERN